MNKTIKSIISIVLALSMMLGIMVPAFAATEELYLSELRLVYANSYNEAKQVLANSKFNDYQILNENLNSGTGEIGVWLAYKTTTNIEEAITDISIMQMGGGYSEGNFQEMIKQSKEEYLAMGDIYLEAIDYFTEAYDLDNFLANSAYRQLCVYAGIDNYEDSRLGDLFVDGDMTSNDLATLFMQGNSYVLKNIRSLLAMGVSYNEEGLTYLQRVSLLASGTYSGYLDESVADLTADDIYISDNADEETLAPIIAATIPSFRTMFEELAAYEAELNYEDEEFTDLEIKYVEYKAIAEMMRVVNYLDGQSLYDFCMNYTLNTKDYTNLYPLVRALNDGQVSMTKVGHFYDVVRYSMSDAPEETIKAQLDELEEQYADTPFNVYTGVDRDIYKGTFALTSAAYRADAYTDSYSLGEALFGNGAWISTTAQLAAGAVGAGLFVWAIVRSVKGHMITTERVVELGADAMQKKAIESANTLMKQTFVGTKYSNNAILEEAYMQLVYDYEIKIENYENLPFASRTEAVLKELDKIDEFKGEGGLYEQVQKINEACSQKIEQTMAGPKTEVQTFTTVSWSGRIFTGALYIAGALSMAYSAISMYNKIRDYYNPTYDVVPGAMVDLIKTSDGDRYIKYDAVLEATVRDTKTGAYHPGDLNAYEAQRWNAIYYTKSYEAGKPLLADFVLSNASNRAGEGYLPVHRFGEVVCYDLNKYTFKSSSDTIYLSVAQSENQKSAVADVPEVVGSMFGTGFLFLVGGAGLVIGAGATVGVQSVLKKKKSN